jgi:hypothetical protein
MGGRRHDSLNTLVAVDECLEVGTLNHPTTTLRSHCRRQPNAHDEAGLNVPLDGAGAAPQHLANLFHRQQTCDGASVEPHMLLDGVELLEDLCQDWIAGQGHVIGIVVCPANDQAFTQTACE